MVIERKRRASSELFYNKIMARTPEQGYIPNYMKFEEIEWNTLRPVGGGAYGVVLVNRRYAVKLGKIKAYQIDELYELSRKGFAVPVYAYWEEVKIPADLVNTFDSIPSYGRRTPITYYLRRQDWETKAYIADVMVMARATPAIAHKGWNSKKHDWGNPEYDKLEARKSELNKAIRAAGLYWGDSHIGNFGFFGSKPVVLDA